MANQNHSLLAIHGLNGDPIKTWTHKETGVMWLKDLLPEAIPNIRIMTFGYNASFRSFTAQQDLRSTPHNGTNLAIMGKLLANIVSACSPVKTPRALIRTLQKDSQVLLDITGDFNKRRKKVHIIVGQQSAILNVPHEVTIPQYSDHRNIARFKSSQDRSFRPMVSRLREFAEGLPLEGTKQTASSPEPTHLAIPFDLHIQPCPSFRGRDDVFSLLKTYFHGDQQHAQRRRTFAICGLGIGLLAEAYLGGSGKTQIALHYVLRSLSKYKTGIAFVNATSQASLEAGFGRLHDLLKLGEPNDKVGSVRRWLARPRNSHWLLVFDNADNLESVRIQRCFPAVNWGHIIITTRDQGAIGSITEEGHVLRPLMTEDAIQLLLDKSGIRQPTQGDTEDARVIAEFLGSLPLALVQAGTFIRSRHRSLREYCRLYMTRRNELLRFTSHPGDAEMPVLTAWEINFKQVERESPEAFHLLLLFSFLEPWSIPEMLLQRGSSPQKRWGTNGEVEEIRAEEEGVDVNLTKFIQDDFEFDTAMEKLLSFSLISCGRGTVPYNAYRHQRRAGGDGKHFCWFVTHFHGVDTLNLWSPIEVRGLTDYTETDQLAGLYSLI
ncbi:TPR repeat:NB-ARC [Coccidioides immitis RMSCC 2394]|uniref:TPR repeat:NB-ARC n=1 Tax=Coccidioides immitis RMSCC 2394 TaxID=404692 RepID=A0A0J6YQ66_COCIT|nr:TPR repeat:NB-ARC [Coccidioides immitis RMSCC 2394]